MKSNNPNPFAGWSITNNQFVNDIEPRLTPQLIRQDETRKIIMDSLVQQVKITSGAFDSYMDATFRTVDNQKFEGYEQGEKDVYNPTVSIDKSHIEDIFTGLFYNKILLVIYYQHLLVT